MYAALLRGVNVGGRNLLSMKDLAAHFEKAGCSEVKTYIQSGNVVFGAPAKLAATLPGVIASAITKKHKLQISLQLRTHDELAKIAAHNPFLPGAEIERLMVMFLADAPAGKQVAALDGNRSPGDRFIVSGREIYLHCPNGFGNSKLTNTWFDSKLATVSTGRNWKTLQKLLEMTASN